MAETYSILFAGLNASEESFASTHFSRSGHGVITAGDLVKARESLRTQRIDLVYLQAAADDGAVNRLEEIAGLYPSLPVVLVCARATTPEILARLQDAVLSFSANAPQHDDITMMILGYRESLLAGGMHAGNRPNHIALQHYEEAGPGGHGRGVSGERSHSRP